MFTPLCLPLIASAMSFPDFDEFARPGPAAEFPYQLAALAPIEHFRLFAQPVSLATSLSVSV